MTSRLMLENEVAELLRCSKQKVQRLRLAGKLPYIPGRPVVIAQADVEAYLERMKCRHPSSDKKATATGTPSGAKTDAQSARAWALKTTLLQKRGSRNGSCSAGTKAKSPKSSRQN
ncbi:helix-turn-helix domain-containing protein [Agrobacterium tumefaciens]|nr:helix-turn-helix domain-containing protein [Agrobacterium tumefaciens]